MDELLDSINDGDTLSNLSRENCSSHHLRQLEQLVQRLKTLNSRFTTVWQTHSQRMDIAGAFRAFENGYRHGYSEIENTLYISMFIYFINLI